MQIANYAQKNTVKNCRGSLDEQQQQKKGRGEVAGGAVRFILESQPSAHLLHCTVHAPETTTSGPLAVCVSVHKYL